jgi:hypothetical protein
VQKTSLIIFSLLLITNIYAANPFDKVKSYYDKKVEPEVQKLSDKVEAWLKSREEANPKIMADVRKTLADIKQTSAQVVSDLKKTAKKAKPEVEEFLESSKKETQKIYNRVEHDVSTQYNEWTDNEKETAKKEGEPSALVKASKTENAKTVYKKISESLKAWQTNSVAVPTSSSVISELDKALSAAGMNGTELGLAVNDKNETLLDLLVSDVQKRETEIPEYAGNEVLDTDAAFQLDLTLIKILCKVAPLASVKDIHGKTIIGRLAAQSDWAMIDFILAADNTAPVLAEVEAVIKARDAK